MYIETGNSEGAELLCGGGTYDDERAKGNFVQPTVFASTRPAMKIVREEIFGPVLVVQLFDTEEEAIALANDTVYGLAGGGLYQRRRAGPTVHPQTARGHHLDQYIPPHLQRSPTGEATSRAALAANSAPYGYEAYTEVKQINTNLAPARLGWFRHS